VSAVPECANSAQVNDTFACLREANVTSLVAATDVAYAKSDEQFPFQPAIDGPGGLLPDLPSGLWERGEFAKIPFLTGNCKDEGASPLTRPSVGVL
jgi:carboxylesterase type B